MNSAQSPHLAGSQQAPAQQLSLNYQQPATAKPRGFPVAGLITGCIAACVGVVAFLIAGFEGHRAGWELMAVPAGVADVFGLLAMALGLAAMTKRQIVGGLLAIGLGAFGGLLGSVGFILGA